GTWAVLLENEGHLHVHAILDDLALVNHDLLVFDPCAAHIAQGFVRSRDPDVDRILKALTRSGADFGHARNGHVNPPVDSSTNRSPEAAYAREVSARLSSPTTIVSKAPPTPPPAMLPSSAPMSIPPELAATPSRAGSRDALRPPPTKPASEFPTTPKPLSFIVAPAAFPPMRPLTKLT